MTRTERDTSTRLRLLNKLLTTPHRKMDELYPFHQQLLQEDPIFYGHLASWYQDKGEVRDHKEVFVAHLLSSDLEEHREAGYVFLQTLPPYQVARIIRSIKEKCTRMPRSTRTAVRHYLTKREEKPAFFDRAVLRQRKAMKYLYATLHIRPSDRANSILFLNAPPEDSLLYCFKQFAKTDCPKEQARLLGEYKLPYTIAVSAVKEMTPEILLALVDAMTPQEVINNMGSLKRTEVWDTSEVQALIAQKLKAAQTDKRVSTFKARKAAQAVQLDQKTSALLEDVVQEQLKQKGSIECPTALLIDKSGSMLTALEVGKQIAAMVSNAAEAGCFVYAFDEKAKQVRAKGTSLTDWEMALQMVFPGGGSCPGSAIQSIQQKEQFVEQLIVVTDEQENTQPSLAQSILDYQRKENITLRVVLVRVGARVTFLQDSLRRSGIEVDTFTFEGDYYALPNLLPMLAHPSKLGLLIEIMSTPLPERYSRKAA